MRLHRREPSAGFDAEALRATNAPGARPGGAADRGTCRDRQGADPALVDWERGLQRAINAAAQRQMALLGNKQTEGQAAALAVSLDALLSEYQTVQGAIRAASPRYAALTNRRFPRSPSSKRSSHPDTALVEFALGRERSYGSSLRRRSIPPSSPGATRSRRQRDACTRRSGIGTPRTRRSRFCRHPRSGARARGCRAVSSRARPPCRPPHPEASAHRRGRSPGLRALRALPLPRRSADSGTHRAAAAPCPLLATHEVLALPSAAVLSVLRRRHGHGRPTARAWPSWPTRCSTPTTCA